MCSIFHDFSPNIRYAFFKASQICIFLFKLWICTKTDMKSGITCPIPNIFIFGHLRLKRHRDLRMRLIWFWLFLAIFLQTVDVFCYFLLFKLSLSFKNGQNLAIFGQNSHFWVFLVYLPNAVINFIIFGIETTLLVFFEKTIVYMPGQFWDG